MTDAHAEHWRVDDWRVVSDGRGPALRVDTGVFPNDGWREYRLRIDWRIVESGGDGAEAAILLGEDERFRVPLPLDRIEQWRRAELEVGGGVAQFAFDGEQAQRIRIGGADPSGAIGLTNSGARVEWANAFVAR